MPAVPAAERTAPATAPDPLPDIPRFATSSSTPTGETFDPYLAWVPLDVYAMPVDSTGRAVWWDRKGVEFDHPVRYAQYGISALIEYDATGDPIWLERAIRNATALADIRVERDGAWWFPYGFDWTYYVRTLYAPWWSGMAQGQALSLFVRLAEAQPENPTWAAGAEYIFKSFTQARSDVEPWSTVVIDGSLWFEEYAGNQPPLQVLNGHVFALFGLYDYWQLTGDEVAAELFDGGATTVLTIMPLIRQEGGISYYCAQADYCRSPDWQNPNYHPIHVWQLDSLAQITGVPEFADWSVLLDGDA